MPRPTDVYGSELKPVSLYSSSGRALEPSVQTLVSGLAIRDTTLREYVADVSGYVRRMLAVVSTLNQAVTLTLSFSISAAAASAPAQFVTGISVPAGATRYIGPDGASNASFIGEPRLGPNNYAEGIVVGVQASIAPTSGTISVYMLRNAF